MPLILQLLHNKYGQLYRTLQTSVPATHMGNVKCNSSTEGQLNWQVAMLYLSLQGKCWDNILKCETTSLLSQSLSFSMQQPMQFTKHH